MENLLNVDEVSAILKIEKTAVYRLAREGVLPSIRIGSRKIRFPEFALQQFVEEQLSKNSKAQNQGYSFPTAA